MTTDTKILREFLRKIVDRLANRYNFTYYISYDSAFAEIHESLAFDAMFFECDNCKIKISSTNTRIATKEIDIANPDYMREIIQFMDIIAKENLNNLVTDAHLLRKKLDKEPKYLLPSRLLTGIKSK